VAAEAEVPMYLYLPQVPEITTMADMDMEMATVTVTVMEVAMEEAQMEVVTLAIIEEEIVEEARSLLPTQAEVVEVVEVAVVAGVVAVEQAQLAMAEVVAAAEEEAAMVEAVGAEVEAVIDTSFNRTQKNQIFPPRLSNFSSRARLVLFRLNKNNNLQFVLLRHRTLLLHLCHFARIAKKHSNSNLLLSMPEPSRNRQPNRSTTIETR